MSALRASISVTVAAALLSAVLVLGFELLALSPDYRASQLLSPWASAGAMAVFALVAGAVSTAIAALLSRRLQAGLALFALGVLAIGIWLSQLAVATKPVEAPMYLALHVVFVVAFGIAIPMTWFVRARIRPAG